MNLFRFDDPGEFVRWITWMNFALFFFNLIPAFPMDGGRILRSLLAAKMGKIKATKIASFIGRVLAIGFVIFGVFNQQLAFELAGYERLALICGRYEGFDERIREHLATHVLSIGDYILTGGELPALIVMDAIARLQPGVLGDENAPSHDSFTNGLLEHPQYTRPPEFRGWKVPEVLLQGNHAQQAQWKRDQSLIRTLLSRPDLLLNAGLSEKDCTFLEKFMASQLKGLSPHKPTSNFEEESDGTA